MSLISSDYGIDCDGPKLANFEMIASSMDMVDEALARVPFEAGDSPFVIVDYGTAYGALSMDLMKHCIEWVKNRYGEGQAVCVIYEDQLNNDFNKLFRNVLGKSSFVHNYKNVSIMASATGFYSVCVPKKSVHLGYSVAATHHLSRTPCYLKDTLLSVLSENAKDREAFQKQAAKDWEHFLLCRAEELVPGGQLVVSALGKLNDAYSQYTPATHKKSLAERLSHFWRVMRDNVTITQGEFRKATFCWYYGDKAFFKAPVSKADSIVSRAGMRLVRIESATTKSSSSELWTAPNIGEESIAREKYGEQYSRLVGQFTKEVFRAALSDGRSEKEKESLVHELYATLAKDVALSPGEYTTATPHYRLRFQKEKENC